MVKKLSLLLFLLSLLVLTSFVSATNVPILTDSVFMPDSSTIGSCSELCNSSPSCDCEQNCACTHDDSCLITNEDDKVVITFFYSTTCPHCHEALDFFDDLSSKRDDFILEKYEVVHNETDRAYAIEFCKAQDVPFKSVPTFFIGDDYFIGYSDSMDDEIISAIDVVKKDSVVRPVVSSDSNVIKIPLFGTLDATVVSLPVLAVVLGFIDGFNPCAFFVLFFLLSMLVYAKSRKRMALIGGIFVFFSGLIYFVFMSAWLNFFLVTQSLVYITTIAGLIALVIALINIKDFFAFKKGVSLSISDNNRKSLIKKMRGLLKAESLPTMIVGTIVLAVSANLYELLCTAGFPMVFTKALTLQSLSMANYYLYLLLYCIVYVIPLLIIVLVFTVTLGSKKLSQEQGEVLKLLSGMMMLALGGMLVFKPALLNNIVASIVLIFGALCLTFVIVYIRKKIKHHSKTLASKTGLRKLKQK